jgi:SOS response regulatory protein OraA/RecX
MLARDGAAVCSFATLAGPVINGYAFCDLAKQKEFRAKAVAWVKSNSYEVMFMARAPAMPGDRAENHKRVLAKAKEHAYFDDAKNAATFYATRNRNDADVKFCWK